MSVKKYDIEIPRMDYQVISLGIRDDNGDLSELGVDDLIYMTVSLNSGDSNYLIQKSLSDGIVFNSATNKYDITIESDDTKNMNEGTTYGYDITIYYGGNKPKQKVIGNFKLGKKFTINEVN